MHNNHDKSHHETTTICVTTNQPTRTIHSEEGH
jgi:hypothetical protein